MPKKSKGPRRSFSVELKPAGVDLVVKPPYSFKAAAAAVGVAVKSLSDWHAKLVRNEIRCFIKRPQRAEMEREIFKKPRRMLRGSHNKIRMDQRAS